MGTEHLPVRPRQATSVVYCAESRGLLDAFGEAVHEVLALHEQQFVATVNGDSDSDRFDILIHMANERKQEAKYAYLHHLETHGCSSGDDIHQS